MKSYKANAELSGGEAVRSDALLASLGALAEKWEKLGEECGGDYEDRSSFAFEQCAEELLETMKANAGVEPRRDSDVGSDPLLADESKGE